MGRIFLHVPEKEAAACVVRETGRSGPADKDAGQGRKAKHTRAEPISCLSAVAAQCTCTLVPHNAAWEVRH